VEFVPLQMPGLEGVHLLSVILMPFS